MSYQMGLFTVAAVIQFYHINMRLHCWIC